MIPLRINTYNFECSVLQSKLPVILVFGAIWDRTSRKWYSQLEHIPDKFDKYIIRGKVELDYNCEIFADYGIVDIPSLVIFEDGKIFEKRTKYNGSSDVMDFIKRFFGAAPH